MVAVLLTRSFFRTGTMASALRTIIAIYHFFDTEFGFGAKGHTNEKKLRLSVGIATVVVYSDESVEMETEPTFEMIISDWVEHLHRTPMNVKKTSSWSKAIDTAACNNDVEKEPEKVVIERMVHHLKEALERYPSTIKQSLIGHYSDTVDAPALCDLAALHCDFDLRSSFDLCDTRKVFGKLYDGLKTNALQTLLKFEADGGNAMALAYLKLGSAHLSALFDAKVTGFLYHIEKLSG
jgi:hypothetical protein